MTRTLYTSNGYVGDSYNSSMSLKDVAKLIRKRLKAKYPDCKFSVRTQLYSGGGSIYIHLMAAPFNPFAEISEAVAKDPRINRYQEPVQKFLEYWQNCIKSGSTDINRFYIDDSYILSEAGKAVAKDMSRIALEYNYDDSDSQIDYFDTKFYLHLEVGKWDRPFVLTA